MKTKIFSLILTVAALFYACQEGERYNSSSNDQTQPAKPKLDSIRPLYGGARLYYTPPKSENVLQIMAEYTNSLGDTYKFSSSYFLNYLDVIGMGDMEEHTVKFYAVSRAGIRSEVENVKFRPLESAVTRVVKSVIVRPGFNAFLVDWTNELEQSINIYVYFKHTKDGVTRDITSIMTSNQLKERRFVSDLVDEAPVPVKIEVKDLYGNTSGIVDFGSLKLLSDEKLPKDKMTLPQFGDSVAGIPMMWGNSFEGRTWMAIDDIIQNGTTINFVHAGGRGRTGYSAGVLRPNEWNLMIDLGDYYELSRVVTHQRHSNGHLPGQRGQYYMSENVGMFRLYIMNETTQQWDSITTHQIPIPTGMSDLEIYQQGQKGDLAYFYPEEPGYTPRTRWIRYEALRNFDNNYTGTNNNCLSEITVYGRKAQ